MDAGIKCAQSLESSRESLESCYMTLWTGEKKRGNGVKQVREEIQVDNLHFFIYRLMKRGQINTALALQVLMRRYKIVGNLGYTVMIDSYTKKGDMDKAMKLLQEMRKKGVAPDQVAFTSLIFGYERQGNMQQAFEVMTLMAKEGVVPSVHM